jgi:hypothetical protein
MGERAGTSRVKAQSDGTGGLSSREHRGSPGWEGGVREAGHRKEVRGASRHVRGEPWSSRVWQVSVDGDLITAA